MNLSDELRQVLADAYEAGYYTGVFDGGGMARKRPISFEDWLSELL